MAKPIRFGLIGNSRIAQKAFIPMLAGSSAARLVMVGSRSPNAAGADRVAHGTYADVLANPDIDAVYISLPNSLHEEWAVRAVEAGKHVWCEKPAALSYASAKRMVAAAAAHRVRLMEGFMFLEHPQHEQVRALIAGNVLGDLLSFGGRFSYPRPADGNIRLDPKLGGGSYFDAAVYPIRASRMIYRAEPERVAARLKIDAASRVDVRADLMLLYPEDRTAFISSAFSEFYESSYSVTGTLGKLTALRAYAVAPEMETALRLERADTTEHLSIAPADHFLLTLEAFCAELSADAPAFPYESDLLAQARVVEAGRRAAEEGRIVELTEIS